MFLFELLLDRAVATGASEAVVSKIQAEQAARPANPDDAAGDMTWQAEKVRAFAGRFSLFLHSPEGATHLDTETRKFHVARTAQVLAAFSETLNTLPGARAMEATARESSRNARRNLPTLAAADPFDPQAGAAELEQTIFQAMSLADSEARNAISVRERLESALEATGAQLLSYAVEGYMSPGPETGSPVLLAALNEAFPQA
jgi:hypothetical protein